METANKSSAEIGNMRDEKEKELQRQNDDYALVTEEYHRIGKELLVLEEEYRRKISELKIKRADAKMYVDKARHLVQHTTSDHAQLSNAFWTAKRSGL